MHLYFVTRLLPDRSVFSLLSPLPYLTTRTTGKYTLIFCGCVTGKVPGSTNVSVKRTVKVCLEKFILVQTILHGKIDMVVYTLTILFYP